MQINFYDGSGDTKMAHAGFSLLNFIIFNK